MNNMDNLELLLNISKLEKENERVLLYLRSLENALFMAQDYEALGLARCLENELIVTKQSLSKSALYNLQLQNLLNAKYGE